MAIELAAGGSPRGRVPGVAALILGLECGTTAVACAAWAWLPVRTLAWPALAAGMAVAVLVRCLVERPGAATRVAWVAPPAGVALVAAWSATHPSTLPILPLAAAVVLGIWWQTGRVWQPLVAATHRTGPGAPRVLEVRLNAVQDLRETIAGQFLAVGALAVLARALRPSASAVAPGLALAGMGIQVLCGLLLLSSGLRLLLLEGAPPGARVRRFGALVAAACVVLAALLPAYPALFPRSATPSAASKTSGRPQTLPSPPVAHGPGSTSAPPPAGPLTHHPPSILWHVLWALLAVLLTAGLLRLAWSAWRSRRPGTWGGWWRALLLLLTGWWEALLSLFAFFARLRPDFGARRPRAPGRRGSRPLAVEAPRAVRQAPRSGAGDPRRRVRLAYRRLLAAGRRKGHVRPPGFSPRRYRTALEPKVGGAAPELRNLTRLYEEARYSAHPVDRDAADTAAADATAAIRGLRDGGDTGAPPA